MSAPSAICRPPPKLAPVNAATTGTSSSRQPNATRWAKFAADPSTAAKPSNEPSPLPDMKLWKSRPAQKLGPSPDRTTARTAGSPPTASIASLRPTNIAQSSPLCLSARTMRTSATWSATSTLTLSASTGTTLRL
jgi:hypothetical protein